MDGVFEGKGFPLGMPSFLLPCIMEGVVGGTDGHRLGLGKRRRE